MRRIRKLGIAAAVFYLLFSTMLYYLQEKMIFLPTTLPESYRYEFDQPFEEFFLETEDGARLNAIHFKVQNPKGVVLYFHGNAGDLSRWGTVVSMFPRIGYDAIVMDYRTYGKSKGKLSQDALLADAKKFYAHTLERYNESDILLYGRSLGSGLACFLATENQPRMVLLESPYYSLRSIARHRFPFLPVDWLLRYHLDSNEYVKEIRSPIALFHGDEDKVIPWESGKALFDSIPIEQKVMYTIQGGHHNDLDQFPEYHARLDQVLELGVPAIEKKAVK